MPRKAEGFAGGDDLVPDLAHSIDRGASGPRSPGRSGRRSLPLMHRDAFGGAGGSDSSRGCPGRGQKSSAHLRDAHRLPNLASDFIYTTPSKRLTGLSPNLCFSLTPIPLRSGFWMGRCRTLLQLSDKWTRPHAQRTLRHFTRNPSTASQPLHWRHLCRSFAARFFAFSRFLS